MAMKYILFSIIPWFLLNTKHSDVIPTNFKYPAVHTAFWNLKKPISQPLINNINRHLSVSVELYLANVIATETAKLVNGEKDPSFTDINPSVTLPTLTAVLPEYYRRNFLPRRQRSITALHPSLTKSIIQQVHGDQYDPNFALLLITNLSLKLEHCPRPLSKP
ncbi:hypothetical protein IW262DRAFT_1293981 [Armillaria fumosa]|nr:hypothetical protein IW262DRAFT_1293981 [Armillaria fumosa]